MPSLLGRLKSRKLIQWAVAYTAGAWALLEATDLVGGQFHWPDWLLQSITVLLGAGFFVTLVVAWFHGERGRQRVSGSELLLLTVLLALAAATLMWIQPGDTVETDGAAAPSPAGPTAAIERENPAVAVLPFENISPDPDDAFFAEGMHEEIITHLAGIAGLDVISRTSVLPYASGDKSLREIAAELSVDLILEGSARRAGNAIRVTAQLVDGRRDTHVWTENFDRTWAVDELLAIQTEIADRIAGALEVRITAEDRGRLASLPTNDIGAYEAYLRGTAEWMRWTEAGIEGSLRQFERAIELDPSFAEPHAGLAQAFGLLAYFGVLSPEEAQPRSHAEAVAALELDSTLAVGHLAMGMYHLTYDRNWMEARNRLERAVALAPSDLTTQWAYAMVLHHAGDFEGSDRAIARARQLDPHSMNILNAQGWHLMGEGRVEDALAAAEAMVELDATSWSARWLKGVALRYRGEPEAAKTELEAAVALSGGLAGPQGSLAFALVALDRSEEARTILSELLAARELAYVPPTQIARVYEALGDVDEAIDWLEIAYEEHDGFLHWANRWPSYDTLRGNPRFQALLRRMNLPD